MSSQPYLVAARKYRPQLFHEIVAQEHVTETLTNAIRLDRLAHAYLFSGPRGVGKTTAARILAKAINCTTPADQRRDGGEPCRACDSCRTFEEGRSMSIIEIDAASNNKVEDIRDLRETVLVPPQGSRRKVYIIDEVHMLSNAAFNALLKTLEEPPPYVLFIFATTEPNKVLPTILSRCQRFDFRRIAVPEIVAHLQGICQEESIVADEASLMLIAHKGDGALRDALSAFDQAVALCGSPMTYAELAQAFGVVDIDLFFEVTRAVAAGDHAGMLALVERITRAGYDMQEFLGGLAAHLRNMLVARTMPDTSLIEAAESIRERYAADCVLFGETDLLRLLMLVDEGEEKLRTSTQPRLRMEMTFLKMASMARSVDLRQALARLDQLERTAPVVTEKQAPETRAPEKRVPEKPAPAIPAPETRAPGQPAPVKVEPIKPDPAKPRHPEPPADSDAPPDDPPPVDPEPRPPLKLVEKPPIPDDGLGLFSAPLLRKPGSGPKGNEPEAALRVAVDIDVALPLSSSQTAVLLALWPGYVGRIRAERIHVSALLQHATPLDDQGQTIVLSVPDEFHRRMLDSQQEYLLSRFRDETGRTIARFDFVVGGSAVGSDAPETPREIDPYEYMKQKRAESPVIRAIFDQFGGEVVW
jgi:DNA polymerase III subunit gamma/tau